MTTEPVETIPIKLDAHGVARIGDSRLTLDVLAIEWNGGATPEQIVEQFPSLALADVYAVIAWMLRHPDELSAYLADGSAAVEEVVRKVEAAGKQAGLRARLRARRSEAPQ
ncbi:MAG: DUF433 domain-containing protein [Pirellulales bacterium]|nr:DUF433 domain-containing protein [Pirellulales bacterium]